MKGKKNDYIKLIKMRIQKCFIIVPYVIQREVLLSKNIPSLFDEIIIIIKK